MPHVYESFDICMSHVTHVNNHCCICSVLQYIVECCSVLKDVAVWWKYVAVCCSSQRRTWAYGGVATTSRLLNIIRLFCKRAL